MHRPSRRSARVAFRLACGIASVAVLAVGAGSARAEADPRALIARAVQEGRREVTIPPGVYRMEPLAGEKIVIPIRSAYDLTIAADGVTVVCTRGTRTLEFAGCSNVTLRGLTITYDPPNFTQGRVDAVAPDLGWIDVRIDHGYPREAWSRVEIVDPATRYRRRGMPFLWGATAAMQEPDVVRVSLKGIGAAAPVGMLAVLSRGPGPGGICHAVTLDNCAGGMVLRDVTIHGAPGMGVVEGGGAGGTILQRVRIVPGAKPPGAIEEPLLSTSWDGILHSGVGRGPIVEDCVIEHCGDDSWSVQSSDYLVLACASNSVVVGSRGESLRLRPGDRLRASLDTPAWKTVDVVPVRRSEAGLDPGVAARLDAAKPYGLWKLGGGMARLTIEGAPGWHVGDSLYCPDRQGNGFVFRRNRVHSSGRLLVKAGEGLVEDNDLRDIHGIVVCPEADEEAAAGIERVIVRRNTVNGSGWFCPSWNSPQAGALSVVQSGPGNSLRAAPTFAHLLIEDNTFADVNGAGIVVSSARDVVIASNRFIRTHTAEPPATGGRYGVKGDAILHLERSADVRLRGNVVVEPGPFLRALVKAGPDLVRCEGLEDGVRRADGATKP